MFLFLFAPEEFFFFIVRIKGHYNSSKCISTGIQVSPKYELVKEITKLTFTNIFLKEGTHLDIAWGESKRRMQGLFKIFKMSSSEWIRVRTHDSTSPNQLCNPELVPLLLQNSMRNVKQVTSWQRRTLREEEFEEGSQKVQGSSCKVNNNKSQGCHVQHGDYK